MALFIASLILGLVVLIWSADRFVEGASIVARHYGMSPLLIGMLVIGFGTSAPEIVVSVLASLEGNSGLALGNAYGSNITNIALILGVTSLIHPIRVQSLILKKELPILLGVSLLSLFLLYDLSLTRLDSLGLLGVFFLLMFWTIKKGKTERTDSFGQEVEAELEQKSAPALKSYLSLIGGLILLIVSSRALVWGAVGIAQTWGVSDVVVGLTVVAVGTSLPELASSLAAAKKGESDMALGNVLGSNLFNTLAVVGISGLVNPFRLEKEVLTRDVSVMVFLTLSLFIMGYGGRNRAGLINRIEGAALILVYLAHVSYLLSSL